MLLRVNPFCMHQEWKKPTHVEALDHADNPENRENIMAL